MKKNLNVIQIKGIRGLFLAAGFVSCLAAGFIYFPGWVSMHLWNYIAGFVAQMPSIGIFQGILLWGITAAVYYIFRKDKAVVCLRATDGLSEDELKQVFADIKKQASEDPVLQSMIKTREAELKIKNLNEAENPETEIQDKEEVEVNQGH